MNYVSELYPDCSFFKKNGWIIDCFIFADLIKDFIFLHKYNFCYKKNIILLQCIIIQFFIRNYENINSLKCTENFFWKDCFGIKNTKLQILK